MFQQKTYFKTLQPNRTGILRFVLFTKVSFPPDFYFLRLVKFCLDKFFLIRLEGETCGLILKLKNMIKSSLRCFSSFLML